MPFFPNRNQQALMQQMFAGNQGMPIPGGQGGMAGQGGMDIPSAEQGGNAVPIGPSFVGPDEQTSRGVQLPAYQPAPNIDGGMMRAPMAPGSAGGNIMPQDLAAPGGEAGGDGQDRQRLIEAIMALRQRAGR